MTTPVNAMTKALLDLGEMMAAVPEAVAGYRAQLQEAGFNETASEMMAVQYHQHIIAMLMKSIP